MSGCVRKCTASVPRNVFQIARGLGPIPFLSLPDLFADSQEPEVDGGSLLPALTGSPLPGARVLGRWVSSPLVGLE